MYRNLLVETNVSRRMASAMGRAGSRFIFNSLFVIKIVSEVILCATCNRKNECVCVKKIRSLRSLDGSPGRKSNRSTVSLYVLCV